MWVKERSWGAVRLKLQEAVLITGVESDFACNDAADSVANAKAAAAFINPKCAIEVVLNQVIRLT
jgi:hypothetical protein